MPVQCCDGQLWRGPRSRRFRHCLARMAVGLSRSLGSRQGPAFLESRGAFNEGGRQKSGLLAITTIV